MKRTDDGCSSIISGLWSYAKQKDAVGNAAPHVIANKMRPQSQGHAGIETASETQG